jgi:hypothetical protein
MRAEGLRQAQVPALAPQQGQAEQQFEAGGAGRGLAEGQGLLVAADRRVIGHERVDRAVGQAGRSASRSRCWRSGGVTRIAALK